MRTGIFLLGMIAGCAAIGSIVSEDIYHSVFFYLLLVCLCVNTILCSVGRLWKNRRSLYPPNPPDCTFYFRELVRDADLGKTRAAMERFLKSAGYKISSQADGARYAIHGERGRSAKWGIFGAHVSLVFIAAGVICGAYAGYDETVALTEGTGHAIGRATEQPYVLRLNKFATSYYEDGTVSDWLSEVTVERDGQILGHEEIKVNHPLIFRGIKVYLASQGVLIQTRIVDSHNKILSNVNASAGDEISLPGGKGIRILGYIPDYDPNQPMVSKTQQPHNPYIMYAMYRNGEPEKRQAVPLNNPQPIGGGCFVVFPQVLPVVGLHVKSDPGLPFIWAGFGLLVIGVCLGYCIPYRQLWVHMVQEKDGLELLCAGRGPDLAIMQDKIRCFLSGNDL